MLTSVVVKVAVIMNIPKTAIMKTPISIPVLSVRMNLMVLIMMVSLMVMVFLHCGVSRCRTQQEAP